MQKCGFLFKNLTTGKSLGCAAEKRWPAASLIKIFIALLVFRTVEKSKLRWKDKFVLDFSSKVDGLGKIDRAKTGKLFDLRELTQAMLDQSDNSSTNLLIKHFGNRNINAFICSLGCRSSVLKRKMGDEKARKANKENYTSLRDLALAFDKLLKNKILNEKNTGLFLRMMVKTDSSGSVLAKIFPGKKIARKNGIIKNKDGDYIFHESGIVTIKNEKYFAGVSFKDKKINKKSLKIAGEKLSQKLKEHYLAFR